LRQLRQKNNTMKHLISAGLLVTATLLLTSCEKRDYTCSCVMSDGTRSEKWLGYMPNNTAQQMCNDHQIDLKNNANGVMPQCKVTF